MTNLIDKIFRKILQLLFGFDKWHVATLKERPYAIDVINYCNRFEFRNSFAEIGCGLGDIIRNVIYHKRVGFDQDKHVLRAAKYLPGRKNGRDLTFHEFTFPDSTLSEKVDTLVMVNWIHHIDPDTLGKKIRQYFRENINEGGQLICDTVADSAYKYNHDIRHLTEGLKSTIYHIGSYARRRDVWAIIKPK